MFFTIEEFVLEFWHRYYQAKNKEDYIELLLWCEQMSSEYLCQFEDGFYDFFANVPLLAMISEIQLACPEAVSEVAEYKLAIDFGAKQLKDLDQTARSLLREKYLQLKNNKVFFLADLRKKKH